MKRFLSCLGFLGLGFCFLALVTAVAIALSGVKEVPFLSSVLYKKPPSLLHPVASTSLDLEEKLVSSLENNQKLELSEEELSAFLEETVKDQFKKVEVNIFTDKVLLLAVLEAERPIYFTFFLEPQNSDNDLEVKKVKVGYLSLPLFLIKNFLPDNGVISLKKVFADQGLKLRGLELKDRGLVLDLDWDKILLELYSDQKRQTK